MINKPLSRRTLLKGTGVVIGLPFLEAMIPSFARAAVAGQKRYVVCYIGTCIGGAPYAYFSSSQALPANLGSQKRALKNMDDLVGNISMIQGMLVPQSASSVAPPPGGFNITPHYGTIAPILSGQRSNNSATGGGDMFANVNAKTSDQIAADLLGSGSKLRSMHVGLQSCSYNGRSSSDRSKMIHSVDFKNGAQSANTPKIFLLELYDAVFAGITGGGGGTPAPSLGLRRGKSVLDEIKLSQSTLINKLSGADKARLDLHFTEIRELETRITASIAGSGPSGGGACTLPTKPGADPTDAQLDRGFGGFNGEDTKAELQADMIALALSCGLTNVATWILCQDQCWLGSQGISGSTNPGGTKGRPDVHQDAHDQKNEITADNSNFFTKQWAYLVRKLKSIPDGGATMLDSTVLSLMFGEGAGAHNYTDYAALIAGMPSQLNLGQYIKVSGSPHPAQVLVTALQAIGYTGSSMNEVNGNIAALKK